METTTSESTPPNAAELKQEDRFEKALADPDAPSPLHLNVYVRTSLGAILFFSLIVFYVTHLSGHGALAAYGEITTPAVETQLTKP